jgi:diacylglycerol kinase
MQSVFNSRYTRFLDERGGVQTGAGVVSVLLPAALWVGDTAVERALLTATCLLVLVVELLNSAVEAVVDRIGRYSLLSGPRMGRRQYSSVSG